MECGERTIVRGAAGGDRVSGDRCVDVEEPAVDQREPLGFEPFTESVDDDQACACWSAIAQCK